ncbi:hypothetical protein DL766_009225 [Monosporascus sp. MC13-8B]|uniref:Rhodopsin domain-containing protein n=1 Tax=Monosporascus cannonballus TaxID=155416 RepID=A0ABY0GW82_9PEZI|nr:hypothetical protein DL762_008663 [Monosporascus cannonballus]RYO81030.1 hypothetical protein DL763_008704 [Monosporascus cannonballus]RYP16088.1 hypothetical protein DL766_009225 [Monosporascus sp. MC13-8B]
MAFDLFNDPLQSAGFVILIIFTPLCIAATALRFVSSWMTLRKASKEDWLALGALLFFLGWVVCLILIVPSLNGESDILALRPEKTSAVLKLCAKLSILFLYHRIFAVNKTFAVWIKVFGLLQIVVSLISFIFNIFQCRPIDKAWSPMLSGGSCVNLGAMLAGTETSNSLIDFAMAVFAVLALRGLQTSRSTKWKLAVIFALAGLAGMIGFIKIGLAFNVTIYNQLMMGLWATVQMAFSVICCCAITYKPLLARTGVFNRITSKLSSYGSKIKLRKPSSEESGHSLRSGWINLEGVGRQQVDGFKMGHQTKTVHIQQNFERV